MIAGICYGTVVSSAWLEINLRPGEKWPDYVCRTSGIPEPRDGMSDDALALINEQRHKAVSQCPVKIIETADGSILTPMDVLRFDCSTKSIFVLTGTEVNREPSAGSKDRAIRWCREHNIPWAPQWLVWVREE